MAKRGDQSLLSPRKTKAMGLLLHEGKELIYYLLMRWSKVYGQHFLWRSICSIRLTFLRSSPDQRQGALSMSRDGASKATWIEINELWPRPEIPVGSWLSSGNFYIPPSPRTHSFSPSPPLSTEVFC